MQLSADTKSIAAPAEKLYAFLTDFHHFSALLPEQVKDWTATENSCAFTIEGLPRISLRIGEKIENKKVTYLPDSEAPVDFSLNFTLSDTIEGSSDCDVMLDADLNPMLAMMAKRPLQNFVDLISNKLQEYFQSSPA